MTRHRIREILKTLGEASGPLASALSECVAEIERLQGYTRRGEQPPVEPEPEELPRAAKGKAPNPDLQKFLKGWEHAYQQFNSEPYPHGGAKDTQAIKRLLLIGKVDDLLDTAWEAWKHPDKFNCTHGVTIAGFASRYANIKLELKTAKNGGRPVSTEPAECRL